MKVDAELVKNVATLAQLEVNASDLSQTIASLSEVLDLADQMQDVPTDGIAPMANPLDATQVLRPDVVTEDNQRDHFHTNSPSVERGYFLVPRVVE